jgi:hypothetical protein
LCIFSLKAGSHHDEGVVAVPRESSCMNLGDDWTYVDNGHNVDRDGAFVTSAHSDLGALSSHPQSGAGRSNKKESKSARATAENTWLDRVLGQSSTLPKSYGGCSVKRESYELHRSDAPVSYPSSKEQN